MCRVQMHNCIDFDGLGALFDSAEFVRYGSEARREGEELAGSVSFGTVLWTKCVGFRGKHESNLVARVRI